MINAQDEFGMDLVRRLWADGNVAAVRFAREVLAAQEGGDRFERYNRNLTFANFVSNSRKWTNEEKKEAECEVPVVRIREGSEVDGFKEVRRLILEGEPVLVRGVGRLLPGGWELLKLDIGKVVDEVESAEDGEQAVKVGSVPYAGYFGLGTERMPLGKFYREFVAQNRSLEGIKGAPYAFAKNPRVTKLPLSVLSEFVQHVFQGDDKPIICPIRDGKNGAGESIHFYLGRAGTGAPTHVHADAMNLLVRGWKRWFVVSCWIELRSFIRY